MASPFAVFRKKQKLMLGFLTILAMFGFVFLPMILQGMGMRPVKNPVVVSTTRFGELHEVDVDNLVRQRQTVRRFLEQIRRATEGEVRALDAVQQRIGASTEESVVESWLMAQHAQELGMLITNEQVNLFLRELTGDRIRTHELKNILNSMKLSQLQLFEMLRQEILAMRFQDMFVISLGATTPDQRWDYFTRLKRRAAIEALPVEVADFIDYEVDPGDGVLEPFFQANRERDPNPYDPTPGFREPKRVALRYFKADYEKFSSPEAISDEDVRKEYDSDREFYDRLVEASRKRELPEEPDTPEAPDTPGPTETSITPETPKTPSEEQAEPGEADEPMEAAPPTAEVEPETADETDKPATAEASADPDESADAKPEASDAKEPADASADEAGEEETPAPAAPPAANDAENADEPEPAGADSSSEPGKETVEPEGNSAVGRTSPFRLAAFQEEAATEQQPAENEGEAATDEAPAEEQGEAATDEPPAEEQGEAATEEQPAEEQGEAATEEQPAEEQGEAATEEQPAEKVEPAGEESPAENAEKEEVAAEEMEAQPAEGQGETEREEPAEAMSADAEGDDEPAAVPATADPAPAEPPAEAATADAEDSSAGVPEEAARYIRKGVLGPQRIESALTPVREAIDRYRSLRSRYEADPTSTPPEEPDYEALAKQHGLTLEATPLVSQWEIQEYDVGKTAVNRRTPMPQYAFDRRWDKLLPETAMDREGNQYLVWKIDDAEARVPEFTDEGVREKVLAGWRFVEARKKAEQRAEELAEEVRQAGEPLVSVFADRMDMDSEDPKFQVIATDSFSWLTRGLVPSGVGTQAPRLSSIEGIDSPNEDFMRAVFALGEGEVGIAWNQPQSIVYVIQVSEITPPPAALWSMFTAEPFDTYVDVARGEQQRVYWAWLAELEKSAGLEWKRAPRGSETGE